MKSLEHTVSAQINDSSSIVNNKKLLLNLGNKTNLELFNCPGISGLLLACRIPSNNFLPSLFPSLPPSPLSAHGSPFGQGLLGSVCALLPGFTHEGLFYPPLKLGQCFRAPVPPATPVTCILDCLWPRALASAFVCYTGAMAFLRGAHAFSPVVLEPARSP